MSDFAESVRLVQQERGMSEELVLKSIEESLLLACRRQFGTDENAEVRFKENLEGVSLLIHKEVVSVEDFEDPILQIELPEAQELQPNCEIGDTVIIEVDPKTFGRGTVHTSKQRARQTLKETQKDTLYSEYKDKVGEIIVGYYQRERNGKIFVNLGNTEGVLPAKYQSSRESYQMGDRIKCLIVNVERLTNNLQITLSRTHSDLVKKIFTVEVPEIYENIVEIKNIVREPGYRTKMAVTSHREEVDPVGACVGMKGIRIQNVIRELEGEKIDILPYNEDPASFIKSALSPAEVEYIYIINRANKQALAVVNESQLSLAIGKKGLNVRLANRLTDWNIDVKTIEQAREMEIAKEGSENIDNLFSNMDEITAIQELPDITERLVEVLEAGGVSQIDHLLSLSDEDILAISGITQDDVTQLREIISKNIQVVDENDEEFEEEMFEEEVFEYECPECHNPINIGMSECPNCGIGLSFEEDEE